MQRIKSWLRGAGSFWEADSLLPTKTFPAFYKKKRFTIVFTKARQWVLTWASS